MNKNIKVVNCTPHDVVLITESGYLGLPSIAIFKSSGIIPRLLEQQQKISSINNDGLEIDIVKKSFLEPEGLPEPQENTLYIVSALVAGACKNRDDLVVPNDIIRDEEGKIVGCKNLAKIV